ncbi:Hydroxyacylglutathione hydrolase [Purpureocillium takamizusanense]|uniref:Hydroxyacylglutathione hydrolase n=1 Tax=Purpureocillium takamizusanense TaxID=2060973 RepID=A0A9Q8VBL0_9HYPO|nr:Hydroxyacylglutathione hydrolase [Purpureocillium takamizusanense]UNI19041.1 Hydroxyacylglutathione hydrolase [Purpureocillium takamizusanense]
MVRYVFNPWRDRDELLLVRRQFYGDEAQSGAATAGTPLSTGGSGGEGEKSTTMTTTTLTGDKTSDQPSRTPAARRRDEQQKAVARVSMWMARQHCPHMVESTALLTAAMLSDEEVAGVEGTSGWSTYAVRATYAAAFSRFVTGLLDGHQDKQRKQSMYAIAKKIGLPATFVELRHQSTHEQLPSLAKLRSMARKALAWIWDYFWKNLSAEDGASGTTGARRADSCRDAVLLYLRGGGGGSDSDEEARTARVVRELGKWDTERVLAAIAELQRTLPGNQVYLRCMKLSGEVKRAQDEKAAADQKAGDPEPDATAEGDDSSAETTLGWSLYEGLWKPKPIGVV